MKKKRWKKYKFLMLLLLIAASITGLYAYSEYNRGLPDTHQLKPSFKLNTDEFLKQFEANEAEATTRYVDNTISVHGTIGSTHITDTTATVFLNDASSTASIICEFQKESSKELQKLKTGDPVTIKGICSGYLLDVILVRCVVDEYNSKN